VKNKQKPITNNQHSRVAQCRQPTTNLHILRLSQSGSKINNKPAFF